MSSPASGIFDAGDGIALKAGHMPGGENMRKIKSIDSIYNEVKDCCFVLTNDAALATALNKLSDKPRIGPFAMTAKQIAAECSADVTGHLILSELETVKAICRENPELDFRYVHGEIQRIREIRQYTENVKKHLFTESSKNVFDSWKALPTVENVMSKFESSEILYLDIKGKVAVVGIDMFNDLDKHMIPRDYLDVDIYEDGEYTIQEIYRIGNDRQLAENAVALIGNRSPDDFAIVINTDSPIVNSVKSALYRKKIPFINTLKVRDIYQIRDFIQFIQLSLSYDTLRIGDVKELFSSFGAEFDTKETEHLLEKTEMKGRANNLKDVMKCIRSFTFDEVRKKIFIRVNSDTVKSVIEEIGIENEKISRKLTEKLSYSVDNINELHHNEKIPDPEKTGVLLVDSRNSVFIDRPVVIYLGMSDDWDLNLSDRNFVDYVEDEKERAAKRLGVLLQQGSERYYLVNTSRGGKPAKPSDLFDKLSEIEEREKTFETKKRKIISDFDDLLSPGQSVRNERWCDYIKGEGIEPDPCQENQVQYNGCFSPSTFNTYYKCPYSFQFYKTLHSEDKDTFEFGKLIHYFAELCFSYPVVAEEQFDRLVQMAFEKYSGISSLALKEIDEGKIRRAMAVIKLYIDSLGYPGDRNLIPFEKTDNFFYNELGITETSSFCEKKLESNEHRIEGKMDLNLNTVIDYKTGKMPEISEFKNKLIIGGKKIKKDFQALFYLAIADEMQPGEEMHFIYVMANDDKLLDEGFDINGNIIKVKICDTPEDKYVEDTFSASSRSKCKDNPEKLTEIIRSLSSGVEQSEWCNDESIITAVAKEFGYRESERKTVVNAINGYVKAMNSDIFVSGNEVVITRKYLDSALSEIDRYFEELKAESTAELPAEHDVRCSECIYYSVCTKVAVSVDVSEGDSDE